jgi:hypothetical protein
MQTLTRRDFLKLGVTLPIGLGGLNHLVHADESKGEPLLVGEATFDITPPLGIELAGFHRIPGQERRVKAIRKPSEGRVLLLQSGMITACLVSLDLLAVSSEFTERVRARAFTQFEISPGNLHLCATHTHSMPTFRPLRQWGGISVEYMESVENKIMEGISRAFDDLSLARVRIGKNRAPGASFNRTTSKYRTDEEFGPEATSDDRWLDTLIHALVIERQGHDKPLVWYHFSSHPVCYADEQAGPDWVGNVADRIQEKLGIRPAFLQGHAGDVNPGSGSPWRGDIQQVTDATSEALLGAIQRAEPVECLPLRSAITHCRLPLDLNLYRHWLNEYVTNPEACTQGPWVDEHFAKSWYEAHAAKPYGASHLTVEVAALQVGEIAMIFHPAELYSFYGLWIRHRSSTQNTLVVGYSNDIIGYLPDPRAFSSGEYAAVVVPKILDLPPFRPEAAEVLAKTAVDLLSLWSQTLAIRPERIPP